MAAAAHQSEGPASRTAERAHARTPEPVAQLEAGFEASDARWVMPGHEFGAPPPAGPHRDHRALRSLQRTLGNQQTAAVLARRAALIAQRDRSPAAGSPPPPGYDPSPEEARNGLVAALGQTSLGGKAAEIFNKYKVGIAWGESGTAGFEDRTNVVHLNRKLRSHELATYFIHEMHHAEQFNSGASKSPEAYAGTEKDRYVKTMVSEEVEALFRQFESIYEAGGGNLSYAGIRPDLPPTYVRVRKDWIGRHLEKNPGDNAGAEKVSQSKCRQLIRIWVDRPSRSTSPALAPNLFQSYQEYYEGMFDSAQKSKTTPPTTATGGEAEPPGGAEQAAAEEPQLGHEESKVAAV